MELSTNPAAPPADEAATRLQLAGNHLVRVTDAKLTLQSALPYLTWQPDPFVAGGSVCPLSELSACLYYGITPEVGMLRRPPFAQVLSVHQCHLALQKLVECGLSLNTAYEPDTFAAAVYLAADRAGPCPELTMTAGNVWAVETFAEHTARVGRRAQQITQDPSLDFITNIELGRLTQTTDMGQLHLAPLADMVIGTGDFVGAECRLAGTRFHTYMTDIVELANIPVSMRLRAPIVARSVCEWYVHSVWPIELRNTVMEAVDTQLDLQARARYHNSATSAACIAERFETLLKRLPSLREVLHPLPAAEAYKLAAHLVTKLSDVQSSQAAMADYCEADKVVEKLLPSMRACPLPPTAARDKIGWIVQRVSAIKAAPKLLPSIGGSSGGFGSALVAKGQAASLSDIVTSRSFLSLVADVQPHLTAIAGGLACANSVDAVFNCLRRCFLVEETNGVLTVAPITAVVQWLASDVEPLPYHEFFTEMVWVRDNLPTYFGRGIASDDLWNLLPMAAGFVLASEVVRKLREGLFHLINFYNEIYLALRSFINGEAEVGMDPKQLWRDTDAMRRMLPVCNKAFEMLGYGGPERPYSFASVITTAIAYIDNAPVGLNEVHIAKVAAGMPLLLEAVGKTYAETMKGMPGMAFPSSFVNPTLHATHMEAIATDQAAAAQAMMLNKSYPGFLSAIARSVSLNTAVIPSTGLVQSHSTAAGKRPAAAAATSVSKVVKLAGVSPAASSTLPATVANSTKQGSTTAEGYIGLAAHMVKQNNTTLTITNPRSKAEHVFVKHEMAKLQNCGVHEKCWGVGASVRNYPENLMFCTEKGKPGHEAKGIKHQFILGFSSKVQNPPFRKP